MTRERYVRLPEVMERSGLSRTTINRRMRLGTFPKSVKLGANAIAWPESEFEKWMQAPAEWTAAA